MYEYANDTRSTVCCSVPGTPYVSLLTISRCAIRWPKYRLPCKLSLYLPTYRTPKRLMAASLSPISCLASIRNFHVVTS